MYESFFGLVNRPFLASPSLDRYYPTSGMEQAVQTATRVIARAEGPVAIFGGSGLGKTICCLRIAEQFRRSFEVVMLASSPIITRRALLQSLLFELKMPYRDMNEGELRLTLMNRLQPSAENASDGLLLIIDEAQTLSLKLLDEIRLLTNVQRNGLPRVRLILCGNLKLEETLCHPQMDSLNQRLASRCYLMPLSKQETANYVIHKIELCGVNHARVITPDALEALHRGSDGIPRLIDQLADQAMLIAAQEKTCPVTADIVGKAWGMLQQLPNPWSEPESIKGTAKSVASIVAASAPMEARGVDTARVVSQPKLKVSEEWGRVAESSGIKEPAPAAASLSVEKKTEKPSIIEFGRLDEVEETESIAEQAKDVNSIYTWQTVGSWNIDVVPTNPEKMTPPAPHCELKGPATTGKSASKKPQFPLRGSVAKPKAGTDAELFGSDFDEEFNLPIQSHGNMQSMSGAAFGNLNHDLEQFSMHGEVNSYNLPEADEFLESPAIPSFEPKVAQERNRKSGSTESFSRNASSNPSSLHRWDESQSLPGTNGGSVDAESLERQVEEEMRELVSELNLSAMTFDPTQIIVELEPSQLQGEIDGDEEYDDDSYHGINSFAQMGEEWNEGNVYAESSKSVASDDRDMLVVQEDFEEVRTAVVETINTETSQRPVLHPYAKLFSNLRKN